jgi:hypothetical protein
MHIYVCDQDGVLLRGRSPRLCGTVLVRGSGTACSLSPLVVRFPQRLANCRLRLAKRLNTGTAETRNAMKRRPVETPASVVEGLGLSRAKLTRHTLKSWNTVGYVVDSKVAGDHKSTESRSAQVAQLTHPSRTQTACGEYGSMLEPASFCPCLLAPATPKTDYNWSKTCHGSQ